jgi:dihydroorotate dehydrogenase
MALYPLIRPLLFRLPPERAHALTFGTVGLLSRVPGFLRLEQALYRFDHPALHVRVWGRELANPVGLAAGLDKDGALIEPLLALGFGLVETGTVTPRSQHGNPQPRLFRLPEDQALVNRLGFNNRGVLHLVERLRRPRRVAGLVGANLGKQRETALDAADVDYMSCLHAVYPVADYVVVNLSSPNTPGLRSLQSREMLERLIKELVGQRRMLAETHGRQVPLLVKVAPDLSETELDAIVQAALDHGVDGLVATNTTLRRDGLLSLLAQETGGLSGRPLRPLAIAAVARLHRVSEGRMPIVGVGGIASADDAYAFIRAGATLVQLYTGLVYEGPRLVRHIKRGLVRLLARDGFSSVAEAVGTAP